MAVNVTSQLSALDSCEAVTGWTPHNITGSAGALSAIAASDEEAPPKEGTYCLGFDLDVENGGFVYSVSSTDYSTTHVYIWVFCFTAANLETLVPSIGGDSQSGIYIIGTDGTNYGYWHVGGSDTYKGGWRCFVAYLGNAPDTNSGTAPNMAACTGIGVGFNHPGGKSKLAHNCFFDYLRVGNDGLKVTTDSSSVATWQDLVDGDDAIDAGIIRKDAGAYVLQGPIQFGDTSSGDMEFYDTSQEDLILGNR